MTFWDVGGQAVRLWKHYFDSIDGIIYVLDATDKDRLIKARDEIHKINRDPSLNGVPFMIMINKCDLEDKRMTLDEISKKLEVDILKSERILHIQECSALTCFGIWEGLSTILTTMGQQLSAARTVTGTASGGGQTS